MKGTLQSVSPKMKDGAQRSFGQGERKLFVYNATIIADDGTPYTGEVNGKTEGAYRIKPGEAVEFTSEQGQYGLQFKIDRPKDGSNGQAYSRQTSSNGTSGGWSKEKENSVMIQGLLKSIIESGMESKNWEDALHKALEIHDKVVAERVPPANVNPNPVQPRQDAPPIAGYTQTRKPTSIEEESPF